MGPSTTPGSEFHKCHIAFNVSLDELLAAGERLNAARIQTQNFAGEKTTEPSVIGWMPSAQLFSLLTTMATRSSLSRFWTNLQSRSLLGRSQNGSSGAALHEIALATHSFDIEPLR